MSRAETLAALAAAGLARVTPDLERLLAPSIRLTTSRTDEDKIAVGASKLGGLPDMPAGAAWPIGKGAPLAFITQIRLEDVRAFEAAQALPAAGLLTFFYDAAQQTYGSDPADRGGWQVLYAGDPAQLQRLTPPPTLPASARYAACAVTFAEELTLPQQPELELPQLDWTAEERARYEQVLASFPNPADHAAIHNRLLGYPDTLQDDMRLECQLAAHGVSSMDDPRAAQLARAALSWRLLLQVDSDEHAGMRWGDAGMLYFWIESDALQARRFGDTWVVLQSD